MYRYSMGMWLLSHAVAFEEHSALFPFRGDPKMARFRIVAEDEATLRSHTGLCLGTGSCWIFEVL